jgi:hypothetical protein
MASEMVAGAIVENLQLLFDEIDAETVKDAELPAQADALESSAKARQSNFPGRRASMIGGAPRWRRCLA